MEEFIASIPHHCPACPGNEVCIRMTTGALNGLFNSKLKRVKANLIISEMCHEKWKQLLQMIDVRDPTHAVDVAGTGKEFKELIKYCSLKSSCVEKMSDEFYYWIDIKNITDCK